MGCCPVLWLLSLPLVILTHGTLHIDASPMVQCPDFEYMYCNITYQYCDQNNPQCLYCRDICDRLPEDSLLPCRTYCPIYYKIAIEAAAKEVETRPSTKSTTPSSTTPLYSSTTEHGDPRPISAGCTCTESSGMGAGAILAVVFAVLLGGHIMIDVIMYMRRQDCLGEKRKHTGKPRSDGKQMNGSHLDQNGQQRKQKDMELGPANNTDLLLITQTDIHADLGHTDIHVDLGHTELFEGEPGFRGVDTSGFGSYQ